MDDADKAYEPLPRPIRQLILAARLREMQRCRDRLAQLETCSDIEFAKQGVDLFEVPDWVRELVGAGFVRIPRIRAYPSKYTGAWRIETGSAEWYIGHDELLRVFQDKEEE